MGRYHRSRLITIKAESYEMPELSPRQSKFFEHVDPELKDTIEACGTRVAILKHPSHESCEDSGKEKGIAVRCKQLDGHLRDSVVHVNKIVEDHCDNLADIYDALHETVDSNQWVWTFPPDVQKTIKTSADLDYLCKITKEIVDEFLSRNGRFKLAFEVVPQYWHTENPFQGWFPHLHMWLQSLVYDRETESFRKIDVSHVKPWEMRFWLKLKRKWVAKVEKRFGKSSYPAEKWNVHWCGGYHGIEVMKGRLKYVYRRAINDITQFIETEHLAYERNGDVYARGKKVSLNFIRFLLHAPKHWKHVHRYGWISDSQMGRYFMLATGFKLESKKERMKRPILCKKCGSEYKVKIGVVEPLWMAISKGREIFVESHRGLWKDPKFVVAWIADG